MHWTLLCFLCPMHWTGQLPVFLRKPVMQGKFSHARENFIVQCIGLLQLPSVKFLKVFVVGAICGVEVVEIVVFPIFKTLVTESVYMT